jgi:hypothetical protein
VQGTSNLTDVPILYFVKFGLGMGDMGGQLFDSLRNVGWFLKPLWGWLSDRIALFGYHRKSWFVLMALSSVVLWVVNAALAWGGVRLPVLFLLTFNLAFATYAFVDVVCDALMVEHGRKAGRVGSFVNFQWTVLAVANAAAVLLGAWLQDRVQAGTVSVATIFLLTGIPPLFTAGVGIAFIDETRHGRRRRRRRPSRAWRRWPGAIRRSASRNRTLLLLAVFIFFWRFSPSVGYVERSYLIDERAFDPTAFGVTLAAGSVTFLVSLVTYRWIVRRFPRVSWHHYLYAMVAIGVLSFPLALLLYLEPDHPWWRMLLTVVPPGVRLPAGWNRYEAFRLITEVILRFATTPAFLIPLTIAGETVRLERAGASYAVLTALANLTNVFEGMVGAGLYALLSHPGMRWLLGAFRGSVLDVAGVADERTIILQLFVYVGLFFTLLTLPFVYLLHGELTRREITIDLAGRGE